MSKHISPKVFIKLPSGQQVHPSRLILKDGSLMWKHALLFEGSLNIPKTQAHEAHIIKTAQRLEELNSWVSETMYPWDCFAPYAWYIPNDKHLSEGISLYFNHVSFSANETYAKLSSHIQDHEHLEVRNNYLYFKRC